MTQVAVQCTRIVDNMWTTIYPGKKFGKAVEIYKTFRSSRLTKWENSPFSLKNTTSLPYIQPNGRVVMLVLETTTNTRISPNIYPSRGEISEADPKISTTISQILGFGRWLLLTGGEKRSITLPLTFSHLKMDGWNTTFLLGRPTFRGYVSFREGNALDVHTCTWQFCWWPFWDGCDLQLGDKKVTLNHLVLVYILANIDAFWMRK